MSFLSQCKSVNFFSEYLKLLFFSDDVTKFAREKNIMNIMSYFLLIKPNYKLFLLVLFNSEILHMMKIKCHRMLFRLCINPLGILVPF